MDRVELGDVFSNPPDYCPPEASELKDSTHYPNLNSMEYRNLPANTAKFETFYELLVANKSQSTFMLAANALNSRVFDGSLVFYDNIDAIGSTEKYALRSKMGETISDARFIDETIVLLSNYRGSIQLWSTQSDIRNECGRKLSKIASRTEHMSAINAFDVIASGNQARAVTVSSDRCVKIWEIGPCDIFSERTYRHAHADVVTDVTVKPNCESMFCTASDDKSFNIWDRRLVKPVVAFQEGHTVAYTTCQWLTDDRLCIGDESGHARLRCEEHWRAN